MPGGWAVWNCHPLPGQVGPLEPSEQHGTRRSSASWVAAPAGPGAAAVPWTLCVRFRTGRAVFTPTEAAGAARMARGESNPIWGQELGCPTVSVNHNVDMANPQSRKLPGSEDPREQVPGARSPTLGPPRPDVAPKAKGSHMQGKPDSGLLCPHTLPSSTSGRWYGLPCPLLHGATTPPFRVQRALKRPRALRTCSREAGEQGLRSGQCGNNSGKSNYEKSHCHCHYPPIAAPSRAAHIQPSESRGAGTMAVSWSPWGSGPERPGHAVQHRRLPLWVGEPRGRAPSGDSPHAP